MRQQGVLGNESAAFAQGRNAAYGSHRPRPAMLGEADVIDDPSEAGMIAKTVAGDPARRLWQALAPASTPPMPYFCTTAAARRWTWS